MNDWKLNLQLFADETNKSTNAEMTAEMKTFYKTALLQFAEPNLVFSRYAKKVPIPKNNGKTIEFRYMSPLPVVTSDIAEGVTPDALKLTMNSMTEPLRQIGAWVRLTDVLQMTAVDPIVLEATKALGSQAGKSCDTLTRDVVSAGTQVLYAPRFASGEYTQVTSRGDLDLSCTMSVDLLFKAAAMLKGQDAPTIGSEYVAVMHPYVAYDLMRTQEWKDIVKGQHAEKIFDGEIGKVGNVRVVESTRAKIWGGAAGEGYSVFATMVLGADAYAETELEGEGLKHIVKQLGYGDDPLEQRSSVGWKALRLAKRLVENYMARIETVSSFAGGKAPEN